MKKIIVFFNVLLLSLLCGMQHNLSAQVPAQDSLALVALYDSSDGPNWSNNSNWLTAESVATWHGITVTNNHVTRVSLSSNNLNGTIPPEIGDLDSLEFLSLNGNQLTGSIPPEIGGLLNLTRLNLSSNNLSGTIPAEISNLTNISNLDFSQNQFTGSIPEGIGQLTNLYSLSLFINNLSGTIPAEIGLLTDLNYLYLYRNQLSGNIPPEIGNLKNLLILALFSNQLTGSIPTEIGSLPKLLHLRLSGNQISGSIPVEIGKLVNLTNLSLSSNQLTGNIPAEIDSLRDLTDLNLGNNALTGSIPAVIGNLTKLTQVSLSLNSLSGPVPESIGNLTDLTYLSLEENSITGVIPDSIGNLTNLTAIYLGENQLSGLIPANIEKMTNLGSLFLNNNQLSGAVPNEIVNITNLSDLGIENNQLEDLPDLSSLSDLQYLVIQNNRFTFEDIEPNIDVPKTQFTYSPQDSVGTASDTTINAGDSLTISVSVGGTANQYQWMIDGVDIPGADSSAYMISSAGASDSGSYVCRISNSIANQLTIYSRPKTVIVIGTTGIPVQTNAIPGTYNLYQNYPNPFNPVTNIAYDLPVNSDVQLDIFNVLGQKVATLVQEKQKAGHYNLSWRSKDWRGKVVASGIYILSLRASGVKNGKQEQFHMLKKMAVIK